MSDSFTPGRSITEPGSLPTDYENFSKNDLAIINAKYDRKKFIAALESGTLACLPGADGLADTQAACNVVNRTVYRGTGQLLLKDFQKQNGFPTAEYCTASQIEKASSHVGEKIYIKKGSKGITLNFQVDGEPKNVRLFNIAQIHSPELIREYADYLAKNRENYLKEKYGEHYHPKSNTAARKEISCSSSNPDAYLGEYLAALSVNGTFRVSSTQAEEFKQKTKDFIFEPNAAGHINPFNLNRLGGHASAYCKQILPEITKGPRQEQQRQSPKMHSPSFER
jgi:hypothetical protein